MTSPNYIEPVGDERAGWHKDDEGKASSYTVRLSTSWERFLKEEGIPVYRGVGIRDSRDLPRVDWPRLGGKAHFIQLTGMNNSTWIFTIEIAPRDALKVQRHMYEERYVVMEGRGSVEVWKEGSSVKTAFEYQPWTCFSIPLNANFRIINSASSPAILLAVNTAPRMINLFQNEDFIWNNPFSFDDRFGGNLEDYWKPGEDFEPQPVRGRAMITSNVIPDVATTYLPLDNNRGPGHRWVAPNMAGNTTIQGWIAEYMSGRYAKAHAHGSGAILVCLRGKGYSYAWPAEEGGINPWKDGKGDLVKMTEYWPGGMVSAAPGPSNWYHQHFAFGKDPFRVFLYTGGVPGNPMGGGGRGGEETEEGSLIRQHAEITEGGNAIPYHMEDPYIIQYFKSRLAEEGAELTMPPEVYTEAGKNINVMTD
jgi:mannose-6-phosphate isomerase-like protein (cupin superfamily)